MVLGLKKCDNEIYSIRNHVVLQCKLLEILYHRQNTLRKFNMMVASGDNGLFMYVLSSIPYVTPLEQKCCMYDLENGLIKCF